MFKFLIPQIASTDLRPMLGVAFVGAIVAGAYGIGHDLFTYSIGPEYFTKLKFKQFGYADFGFPERILVAEIGFLASFWVGFVIAWFLGRRLIPGQSRRVAYWQIASGFGIVIGCGFAFGLLGYGYGWWRGPDGDYVDWEVATLGMGITDLWSFVRVAYIHNASYLGGLVGLIAALVLVRPRTKTIQGNPLRASLRRRQPPIQS